MDSSDSDSDNERTSTFRSSRGKRRRPPMPRITAPPSPPPVRHRPVPLVAAESPTKPWLAMRKPVGLKGRNAKPRPDAGVSHAATARGASPFPSESSSPLPAIHSSLRPSSDPTASCSNAERDDVFLDSSGNPIIMEPDLADLPSQFFDIPREDLPPSDGRLGEYDTMFLDQPTWRFADGEPLEDRMKEPNIEDLYLDYVAGVFGHYIGFYWILPQWCIVQAWDPRQGSAVVSTIWDPKIIGALMVVFHSAKVVSSSVLEDWYHAQCELWMPSGCEYRQPHVLS